MGAIWVKWCAILPPVEGGEWVASDGAVQDDRVSADDNNVNSLLEVDRNMGGTEEETSSSPSQTTAQHTQPTLLAHAPTPALTALTHPAQTEWQTLCLCHVCSQQHTCRFPCPQTGQL